MKKQNKQGISLIVLVITIIVMIILAAAVVITLTNTGIINKANDAVDKSNLQQVKQLASTAWMEGYLDGARTQAKLEEAVLEALEKNNINTDRFNIIVTDKGVDVEYKEDAPKINEYGFYYGQLYTGTIETNPMDIETISFVFYEGGMASGYAQAAELNNKKILMMPYAAGTLNYANKSITLGDGTESYLTISEDGLSMQGAFEGFNVNVTCTFEKMHEAYRNRVYSSMVPEAGNFMAVLDNSNIAKLYMDGTLIEEQLVTISHGGHLITQNEIEIGYLSTDGEVLLLYVEGMEIPLMLTDATPPAETYVAGLYDVSGNLIVSWDTLVSKHGLDISKDYVSDNIPSEPTLLYDIIKGNPEYANTFHIKVSNNVKKIGEFALTTGDLENIKRITIPEGVENIGNRAMALSEKLLVVTIPSTVKSIGGGVFFLSGVTTLNIPASVEDLAPGFGMWSNISVLTVDSKNPYYKSINNAVYTKDGKKLIQAACERKEAFVVQDGTEILGEVALGYSRYTSVSIPASVITIEKGAMEETPDLKSVTFAPNSKLKTIAENVFCFSGGFDSLDIPEGVTEIKNYTFTGTSAKILTLPSTITSISAEYELKVDRLVLKSQVPPALPKGLYLSAATDINTEPIIVVPKGKLTVYKAAEGWSEYADNMIEAAQ